MIRKIALGDKSRSVLGISFFETLEFNVRNDIFKPSITGLTNVSKVQIDAMASVPAPIKRISLAQSPIATLAKGKLGS